MCVLFETPFILIFFPVLTKTVSLLELAFSSNISAKNVDLFNAFFTSSKFLCSMASAL